MPRESRILLVLGFLFLFATIGWVSTSGQMPAARPISAFLGRSEPLVNGEPVVGIVFSPQDCGGLIEQLRLWNGPFLAREARVRGLLRLDAGDSDAMWKIVQGAGLRFPVDALDAEKIMGVQRALGYGGSFVVVFDAQGRVRRAVPLAELSDARARAEILAFVRTLPQAPNRAPDSRT